jgi:galactosyl transferase GMA12/MNN10 family.
MKIGVCSLTIGNEYKEATKYGRLSKVKYCEHHGYDFIDDESIVDHSRPLPWSKILLLIKYLKNYDYLVWMDGDTIIMNSEIKLESFINKYMNELPMNGGDGFRKDFLLCRDMGNKPNTGVWFIRNNEYVMNILELIYLQTQFINEQYWEQAAFEYLYEVVLPDLRNYCHILRNNQQQQFNCWLDVYQYGDFILHFMGIRNLSFLTELMGDHYIYKKDEEEFNQFLHRTNWLQFKYKKCKPENFIFREEN